jgi:SagB-type dehydrogenase family enzyme
MENKEIVLSEPKKVGKISFEQALFSRRSIREYKDSPMTTEQLSQLLWSAQGITGENGELRTAPSAGALYPMEIYITVQNVKELSSGVYKYDCFAHKLLQVKLGDVSDDLADAALGQSFVKESSVNIVISAVFERTRAKYGERSDRYVYIEAGHIAQNLFLQGICLGLGVAVVGAFGDKKVHAVLGSLPEEEPIYIVTVGVV